MFARYRRSSGINAALNNSQHQRNNNTGTSSSNSNNDANNYSEEERAVASLEELRNALDRLEFLTEKITPEPKIKKKPKKEEGEKDVNVKDGGGGGAIKTKGNGGGGGKSPRKSIVAISPKNKKGETDDNAADDDGVAAADNDDAVATADEDKGDDTTATDTTNNDQEEKNSATKVSKSNDNEATATETETNGTTANDNDNDAKIKATSAPSTPTIKPPNPKIYERSPSAQASDIRRNTNAEFLVVEQSDELEMIELIRRVAELVVLSERRAGQLISEAQEAADSARKAALEEQQQQDQQQKQKQQNADDENASDGQSKGESTGESATKEEKKRRDSNNNNVKKNAYVNYNDDAALPHLALFELFCERNALANIVNIVTGVAFIREEEDDAEEQLQDDEEEGEVVDALMDNEAEHDGDQYQSTSLEKGNGKQQQQQQQTTLLLPPLTIATQAVQSISILIQNVSRATSLYFLLSNNRVNDLIRLPLHLYQRAERNAIHAKYNERYSNNLRSSISGRRNKQQRNPPPNLLNYQSSEMGELTTHFVSFLKSLAMRVNAETLQFFLSFPLNEVHRGGADVEKNRALSGEDGTTATESEIASATAKDDNANVNAASYEKKSSSLSYLERRKLVEFPLYARALEFCSTEQDSFVRVTAMNVCMNIIRLATVHNDSEEDEDGCGSDDSEGGGEGSDHASGEDDDDDAGPRQALPTQTPSGFLHEAPTLPLQDRIAIAQYACHPSRVNDLVSPLCARLTSQFGLVEGTVRGLEELNGVTATNDNTTPATKSKAHNKPPAGSSKGKNKHPPNKEEVERSRLKNSIQDLIANVQDELLLLDDLLKVGLISLNEQAIEMMLATFVYPMLLQPLLLPLHRFSSSKVQKQNNNDKGGGMDGASQQGDGASQKKGRRPVITLQSPAPFSTTKTTPIENETGENDTLASSMSKQQTYSSCDMDLSPSKTALFGISVIFDTVSNPTFRHLLLTALLHPKSPEASGGMVIRALPRITLPKMSKQSGGHPERKERGVYSSDDFQLEIRMEKNQAQESRLNGEEFQRDVNVYTFGTDQEGDGEDVNADFATTCVFILAPALVDMLRNHTCLADAGNEKDSQPSSETATRPNPYRSVLLSSISAQNEMVALQPLASAALHAAVASVEDGSIVQKIMFPSSNNSSGVARIAEEVVKDTTLKSLCRGLINKYVTYDGWFKVQFNTVAARTLMDVISNNSDYLELVESIMGDVRSDASEHLMILPSLLDGKSREDIETPKGKLKGETVPPTAATITSTLLNKKNLGGDKSHVETWLLDRFFFDQADKHSQSVVENVCYLKEEVQQQELKEQYRYGLEVLTNISISGTTSLLCEVTRVVDNNAVFVNSAEGTKVNTPFHCAASWALTCLYLDAFCVKLSKMSEMLNIVDDNEAEGQMMRKLSYISSTGGCDSDDDNDEVNYSLAHISSKFAIAILDEGESSSSSPSSEMNKAIAPQHGSAVGLVGKAAFPCVCEISNTFSNLFTGRTCISNEGIQWQSLYLVIAGKWAVLAEPGHGGGEGRVITSCRLSCLAVKKDSPISLVNNKTPARRLLLAHASLDPRPPSLFVVDKSTSRGKQRGGGNGVRAGGPNLGPNGLRLTRSRLDLWFEDANAAGHACKVLSAKIAKARARRGGRIRTALLSR